MFGMKLKSGYITYNLIFFLDAVLDLFETERIENWIQYRIQRRN